MEEAAHLQLLPLGGLEARLGLVPVGINARYLLVDSREVVDVFGVAIVLRMSECACLYYMKRKNSIYGRHDGIRLQIKCICRKMPTDAMEIPQYSWHMHI